MKRIKSITKKIISKIKSSIQDLFDIVPARKIKKVKQLLHIQVEEYSTICKRYKWLRKKGIGYEKQYSRIPTRNIQSNIKKRDSRPLISMTNDMVIEEILKSHKYSFKIMLIITNPYRMAPLTALGIFNTEKECSVNYEVVGDIKEESFYGETDMGTSHRVEILGLYPGRKNKITMQLCDTNHNVIEKREVTILTDPLPSELCDVVTLGKKTSSSSEPFVLISGGTAITTCAFDVSGNIRYYLTDKSKGYGVFLLSNGRFLYQEKDINRPTQSNPHALWMQEMDYSGRSHKTFHVPKGIHHNATEMIPGGNIIACASTCDEFLENAVIELDRITGKVVKEVSMNQLFDETYIDRLDWAHVNAVNYQEKDHTLLVSMRNIHSIAKIDWEKEELIWVLGNPKIWEKSSMMDKVLTPLGPIKWFYQQHAIQDVSEEFELEQNISYVMLYDNHVDKRRKVSFFDEDKASFVSIFRINDKDLTVTMEEKYQFPKSTIRSNSVLKRSEQRVFSMGGYLQPDISKKMGLIAEMDTNTGEILNEYFVKTGFFTAYPFRPQVKEISKSMLISRDYVLGSLDELQRIEQDKTEFTRLSVASKEEVYNVRICEDVILMKGRDHDIEEVYLVGRNNCYKKDFSDTEQMLSVFANMLYSVAIPLAGLENDKYMIYVKVKGALKKTQKWVKI